MKFIKYIFRILLCSLVLISGACESEGNCDNRPSQYEFVIPVTFAPTLDTFRIGDTIHVSSVFSNEVYERVTDQTYMLDDLLFYPSTILRRIDTSESYDNLDYFEFIMPDEYDYSRLNASDGSQAYVGQYNYDNTRGYHLEFDIVVLSKGTFWFAQGPDIELNRNRNINFPGKCNRSGVVGVGELNGGDQNTNIHFFETSPDPHFNQWRLEKPQERFYDNASYVFVVIE